MKRYIIRIMALLLIASVLSLSGCGSKTEDPGAPPEEVIHPDSEAAQDDAADTGYDGDVLENAVTVRIGQRSQTDWLVNMYNNAAAETMLGYLSGSGLLFPTYTYEEEQGFVAQTIRGNYSRDDEITVTDVKSGELYLFSGGQLRFYFKDVDGANITATPVGYYSDTDGLTEAVLEAYEDSYGNVWGVEVYFLITKNID